MPWDYPIFMAALYTQEIRGSKKALERLLRLRVMLEELGAGLENEELAHAHHEAAQALLYHLPGAIGHQVGKSYVFGEGNPQHSYHREQYKSERSANEDSPEEVGSNFSREPGIVSPVKHVGNSEVNKGREPKEYGLGDAERIEIVQKQPVPCIKSRVHDHRGHYPTDKKTD